MQSRDVWCSANLNRIVLSQSIPREDVVLIREWLCLLLIESYR